MSYIFECQNDVVKEMHQQFVPKKYISRPSTFKLVKKIVHSIVNTRWTLSREWMLDTILCTFY